MSERLQKFLARIGVASRRQVEDWIRQGRIVVDGTPAQLGAQVDGTEVIRIDGKWVQGGDVRSRRRVLAYYKPVGEMCSRHDPEGRPTIFEHLPVLRGGRWVAVGRLDLNTQGLLLLTNDGELANRLMHPSSEVEREYAVRILGEVKPEVLQRLREGVTLEDGVGRFDEIREGGGEGVNHWYHVILREGRNREVRRLWESQGVVVSRLVRVRYGSATLRRGLPPGRWDELDDDQIKALLETVGYQLQEPEPETSRPRSPRRTTPRKDTRSDRGRSAPRSAGSARAKKPQESRSTHAKPASSSRHSGRNDESHSTHAKSTPSPRRTGRDESPPRSHAKPASTTSRRTGNAERSKPSGNAASTGRRRTFNPGRGKSDR